MKEDILEQLVDDYLQLEGYFTRHNIKFRPGSDDAEYSSRHDSNFSDIDVLGLNPHLSGTDRVWAVSCKSWQAGFKVEVNLSAVKNKKSLAGKDAWKMFRELASTKWSKAFRDVIEKETGSKEFTYVLAVTSIQGDRTAWQEYGPFIESMGGNPIRFLSLAEMIQGIVPKLTTTPAGSEIGRLLQLIRASEGKKGRDGKKTGGV